MQYDNPEDIQNTINTITNNVNTLTQQLESHEPILNRLGVGIPQNTYQRLNTVQEQLKKVIDRIEDQQTELAQLQTLKNTIQLINSSLDLDHVLNEAMNRVITLSGAERGYIMLLDSATQELETRVVWQLSEEDQDEMTISQSVVKEAIATQKTVIIRDAVVDERFPLSESIAGFSLRSVICVPLLTREEDVIGAVYCDNRSKYGAFGNKEKRLLTAFAHQAAIAIENAQYFEQIKQALDEITQIKVLLDNILASIINGVITTNAEGLITTYNDACVSILNIPAEDMIGRWLHEALPNIHQIIEPKLESVLETDSTEIIEESFEVDGRGIVHLNLTVSPLKDGQNVTQGLALAINDVTALKQRDATLAAVERYLPPVLVKNIRSIDQLALGGERREVTVIFIEVRPFDTFPPHLSPKELMEWLNTYHTIGSEAIHAHTGLIDKYMGNEIMCIFNTQLNNSDTHPWDAVQAALQMAADFRTLGAFGTLGEPPADKHYYRIGIHTGIATMGNVGTYERREFTAIGDNVNLAKRIQENCALGQIVVSEDTLQRCQPYIDDTEWIGIRELEPIQAKGKTTITRVYELFDSGEE